MKKYLPTLFILIFGVVFFVFSGQAPTPTYAQQTLSPTPQAIPDGTWISDPYVTQAGKNASRSGMMLDWTLRDYEWSNVQPGQTNPLIPFWLVIQRIVYAMFLFVVLVTAFILIVTRGKSLSAKRFLPRFLLVVLLVTFSFSLIQFIYQIIDIFEGFFLKNPQGNIISSHDLLFIGFDYRTFLGARRFGESFEESALISLLMVKLTSVTYYVMAILLIVRKIILWFFIVISPIFPLLLLFYPVRNTAKIWIGEFFRWLLYAPLFAIFLSGLVKLWQTNLPLMFNFHGVGDQSSIIYPTAINILLGGPQQVVTPVNNINMPDTFALYLVALIMLWVVIILPFILLQIFLDYLTNFNYMESPVFKQMLGMMSTRLIPPPPATPIPVGPTAPAGAARTMPFTKKFELPQVGGQAKPLPVGQTIGTTTGQAAVMRPSVRINQQREVTQLTNLSIPTMRDIARVETMNLTQNATHQAEATRIQQTLQQLANPLSTTSSIEREKYQSLRERLVTASQKGNNVATTILHAANIYNTYNSSVSSVSQAMQQTLTTLAHPEQVSSTVEKEKLVQIKEQIVKASQQGNQLASTVLTNITNITNNQVTQMQQLLQKLANPQTVTNTVERQTYQQLREKLVSASNSGNQLATMLVKTLEQSTNKEEIRNIQEQLLQAQAQGNPLAGEVLKTAQKTTLVIQLQQVLERLANPQSLKNTTERQTYQQLREKIVAASRSGNSLATMVMKSLEQSASQEQVQKIQEQLSQAQAQGNPLANEILKTVQKASPMDQQQVQKIQQQLVEAKKKGEPLADVLLQLLAQQKVQSAPVSADAKLKSAASFPAVNRVQQVSLDDYEAVKKLWKENYQNLDVPQSLTGAQTRKSWITSDISDIEQTIGLLSSNNPSDVEEGMKHVSDILPFLLVGGFSQSEIVAYLKAKMEAGKTVLETLQTETNEEDTLVETKHTTTQATKHLTVSTDVNEDIGSDVSTLDQTVTMQTVATPSASAVQTTVQTPQIHLLQTLNLKLPTMRDIVSYERKIQSTSSSDREEAEQVKQTLTKIAHADTLSTAEEREKYTKMRQELEKESEAGNQVAVTLLTATKMISQESASSMIDATATLETLRNVIDPSRISDQETRDTFTKVRQELVQARHDADPLALAIMQGVDAVTKLETEKTREFLIRLSAPEKISTAPERTQITKLVERLGQAKESGSELAAALLSNARSDIDTVEANKIRVKLSESAAGGDALATYILSSLVSLPTEGQKQITTIVKELREKKEENNPLAQAILRLIKQQKQTTSVGSMPAMMLPRQNRIQQVSLDDYEAVKQLWKDNYTNEEPPLDASGRQMTREQWLQEDIATVTQAMNLLTSTNQADIDEGMEIIGDILPFLLVGGFSQSEIVAYLKAKMEAAKATAVELKQQTDDQELVSTKKTEAQDSHVQEQAMTLPGTKEDHEDSTQQTTQERTASAENSSNVAQSAIQNSISQQTLENSQTTTVKGLEESTSTSHTSSETTGAGETSAGSSSSVANTISESSHAATDNGVGQPISQTDSVSTTVNTSEGQDSHSTQAVSQAVTSMRTNSTENTNNVGPMHQTVVDGSTNIPAGQTATVRENTISGVAPIVNIYQQINLQLPTLKDVATYETSSTTTNTTTHELTHLETTLKELADPGAISSVEKQQNYTTVKETLEKESKTGDPVAFSLLAAARLAREPKKSSLPFALRLPKKNIIQQVSLDDYEAVKRIWYENYLHAPVPKDKDGKDQERTVWITNDIAMIDATINLLSSDNEAERAKGLANVGDILPFLLVGGFSETEIVGYLRAKREGGKMALSTIKEKEEGDEVLAGHQQKQEQNKQAAAIPEKEDSEQQEPERDKH